MLYYFFFVFDEEILVFSKKNLYLPTTEGPAISLHSESGRCKINRRLFESVVNFQQLVQQDYNAVLIISSPACSLLITKLLLRFSKTFVNFHFVLRFFPQ